jgi:hypothetical protein
MRRFGVKFHGENELGIPSQWPCEMWEIKDFDKIPDDCTIMNEEQYDEHISKYKPLYDEWNVKQLYKSKYLELRRKEYPSQQEMIDAMFEVMVTRLLDRRNFPEIIKVIMDKIAEVDAKYPESQ